MRSICIYLQIHQPFRVKDHRHPGSHYFGLENRDILKKVAGNSYLPTNEILLKLLKKHDNFKISLSFSGVVLDQMEEFYPETLESFRRLYQTGKVEILSETYYHSLAFFYSQEEFERQVEMHRKKIRKIFGHNPAVFRNTELSYNNSLAKWAEGYGFKGVLTEGWGKYLKNRSPNFLYSPRGSKNIKVLLRNYSLSDDISFRFSKKNWRGWPVTAEKFADWVYKKKQDGDTLNLFMDYETFGEHQWKGSGILEFLEKMPDEIIKRGGVFRTVSETLDSFEPQGEFNVPKVLTWADTERDLSAWLGNKMQKSALEAIYDLESLVLSTKDKKIIESWRKLQTSDHFYYMCTKWFADGDIHAYFSPFGHPKEAHLAFMKVLENLKAKIESKNKKFKLVSLPQPV